jgi:hypothetical protein
MFFIVVYLHIGRALYYGSYTKPRGLVFVSGVVIFLTMMATAFIGVNSQKWIIYLIFGILIIDNSTKWRLTLPPLGAVDKFAYANSPPGRKTKGSGQEVEFVLLGEKSSCELNTVLVGPTNELSGHTHVYAINFCHKGIRTNYSYRRKINYDSVPELRSGSGTTFINGAKASFSLLLPPLRGGKKRNHLLRNSTSLRNFSSCPPHRKANEELSRSKKPVGTKKTPENEPYSQGVGEIVARFKKNNVNFIKIYENVREPKTRRQILLDTRRDYEFTSNTRDKSGIYAMVNKINGKMYLGSASTNNIYIRFKDHSRVDTGGSTKLRFENAKLKYGINNFSFVVITYFDEVVTKETPFAMIRLLTLETQYIALLKPEYNVEEIAGFPPCGETFFL